jgi:murein DD-endopeptidase MepM/ murein hydrolase activator NlpD
MPQEGTRQRRGPRRYDIVIAPLDDGGKTRTFRTNRRILIVLAIVGFAASVGVTVAAFMFTPVAMIVPIPNPLLEEKYGKQIIETQRRLNDLAENVVILTDYNLQLRRALGEGEGHDTSAAKRSGNVGPARDITPVASPSGLHHVASEVSDEALDDPGASGPGDGGETGAGLGGNFTLVSTETGQPRATFPLLRPMTGYQTQGFDPPRNHFGIDIAGQRGTPVHAAGDGVVVFSGWTYNDGNMIIVAHGAGYLTVYKHNQSLLRKVLDGVKRGDPIALLGSSGRTSSGPHLHFEVWKNGAPQDPKDYLLTAER